MLIANLYHIKRTNGLFHYGIDYLKAIQGTVRKVLVRPELADLVTAALPAVTVVKCNGFRLLVEISRAVLNRDFIYTPTPHPYPLLSRQIVVLHDSYPFLGPMGRLKKVLLRLALASSKCYIAFINRSEAKPFLETLLLRANRLVFAPNMFPDVCRTERRKHDNSGRSAVGLVGSDSPKKNYDELFAVLRRRNTQSHFEFIVFGHETEYLSGLRARYPDCDITLIDSDDFPLGAFYDRVDMVVSIASNEGFGRPLAGALLAGIPCLLLKRPVFLEFYGDGAEFAGDTDEIARLMETLPHRPSEWPDFSPPRELVQAQDTAVAFLKSRAIAA